PPHSRSGPTRDLWPPAGRSRSAGIWTSFLREAARVVGSVTSVSCSIAASTVSAAPYSHLDVPVHLRPATGGHTRAPSRGIGGTVGGHARPPGGHEQVSMPWGPSRR